MGLTDKILQKKDNRKTKKQEISKLSHGEVKRKEKDQSTRATVRLPPGIMKYAWGEELKGNTVHLTERKCHLHLPWGQRFLLLKILSMISPETREWDKHPGETLLPPLPFSHLLGQFQYLHNLLLRRKCLSITEIKKILHVGKSDFY